MSVLTNEARRILEIIVKNIDGLRIRHGHPETYNHYKEIHDELGLQMVGNTYGVSLSNQGLADLALWAKAEELPAITGMVVDEIEGQPAETFFKIHNKTTLDKSWWHEEVKKALNHDWHPYLGYATTPKLVLSKKAVDINPPPDKIPVTVLRIVRNTAIAQKVKRIRDYKCQICNQKMKINEDWYAEAHHIIPLGSPHNGSDEMSNLLCVCPNDHVRLDYGSIKLNYMELSPEGEHVINRHAIEYHNNNIYGNNH